MVRWVQPELPGLEVARGHHIQRTGKSPRAHGLVMVMFGCSECGLCGTITATPQLAEATVADLMATHWAATGGDA